MVTIEELTTKLRATGISIESLLSKEFVKKMKDAQLDIKPAALVLISEKKEKGGDEKETTKAFPIMFEHGNNKEYTDKILRVACEDKETYDKIKKIIKELGE